MAVVLLFIPGVGFAQTHTSTHVDKEKSYDLAMKMSRCAGFFAFAADMAHATGMSSNAELATGKMYGWKMAALVPLLNGLEPSQQPHAQEILEGQIELSKNEFLGRTELRGADGIDESNAEFSALCMPLVPLQEELVRSMRTGR